MLGLDRLKTLAVVVMLGLLPLLGACTSTDRPVAERVAAEKPPARAAKKAVPQSSFPRISLDAGAHATLGEAFRYVGETFGGGAALTAGLEERPAPAGGLGQTGFVAGLQKLADPYECKLQVTPHYVFLYPPGYESLEALSLEGKVGPRFEATRASFAIGAGTDLFNALALLGNSLQMTVVADNIVADAWCGEVFLEDAPVSAIVEALLKSARVSPEMIEVESTDDYLFIRSTSNKSRPPSCLNRDQLSAEQQAVLQSLLTLRLPDTGADFTFQAKPATLASVLPALSEKLGIPVTATDTMGSLPVNISVFQSIPTETALDLLVRQWLLPRYGYRMEGGGLRFCER